MSETFPGRPLPVSRITLSAAQGITVVSQESDYSMSVKGNTITTIVKLKMNRKLSVNTVLDRFNINDDYTYSLYDVEKDPTGGYTATLARFGERV